MLPALPTGMARMSGCRPRSSQISKAAVFWPSRRNGLTELTRVTGWSSCSASARTIESAWSKLPSIATTFAPATRAWSSLPAAIWPFGRTTMTSMPGGGAVGRRRGGGVAGRGADDGPGAGLGGLGDGHDHAPVLERPGRVLALDLEVEVVEADHGAEPAGPDERREPLAEGQGRGRVGDREEPAVPLEQAGPRATAGRPAGSAGGQLSPRPDTASRPRHRAASGAITARAASRARPSRPDGEAGARRRWPRRAGAIGGRARGASVARGTNANHGRTPLERVAGGVCRRRSPARRPAQVEPDRGPRRPGRRGRRCWWPRRRRPARRGSTVPSGSASISIRLVTPSVRPNDTVGRAPRTARTAAATVPSVRCATAQELDRQAERGAPRRDPRR